MSDIQSRLDVTLDHLHTLGSAQSFFLATQEIALDRALSSQLHGELQQYLSHNNIPEKSGVDQSLLYERLPAEIRHEIYSYVVVAPQSIHIFPPKGNERLGYRLSLCEESTMVSPLHSETVLLCLSWPRTSSTDRAIATTAGRTLTPYEASILTVPCSWYVSSVRRVRLT